MSATLPMPRVAEEYFTEDKLPERFGWIRWLTPSHQRLFAGEFYCLACKKGTSEAELLRLLDAWKATAELDHSPEVREQIERNRKSTRWASADEWMTRKKHTA